MVDHASDEKVRAPYIKPRMEQVELVPEEAVLATCKYGDGARTLCGPDPVCNITARS